mmetsp:Transcript_36977/g.75372  ORF Transcript_36977/g.75372 Transcript_36977/m.75372 type:complete len:301 (+) Transcript_36977:652-1554(+)
MPCRTTTRRVVPLLGLASLMVTMLASHHDARGGIASLLRGIFNKHATVQSSVPGHNERRNWQNSPMNKADLSVLDHDETGNTQYTWPQVTWPVIKPDLPIDIEHAMILRRLLDPFGGKDPVQDLLLQEHHAEQMSRKVKSQLNEHQSWEDFLFALLQNSEDANKYDIELLQPNAFALTGIEYRRSAENCDFFHPYGKSFSRQMFPDDPQRQQRYCSICHSELIRVVKKKAESLLEGVSREAALEGCWGSDGVLHQPGEAFEVKCNQCICDSGRQASMCTLTACSSHWDLSEIWRCSRDTT